jgi:hypothetical protein
LEALVEIIRLKNNIDFCLEKLEPIVNEDAAKEGQYQD